jgi:hypothetical protein
MDAITRIAVLISLVSFKIYVYLPNLIIKNKNLAYLIASCMLIFLPPLITIK